MQPSADAGGGMQRVFFDIGGAFCFAIGSKTGTTQSDSFVGRHPPRRAIRRPTAAERRLLGRRWTNNGMERASSGGWRERIWSL